MTPEDYCKDVCGAKCCIHPVDLVTCPYLNANKQCSIYEYRFVRPDAEEREIVGTYITTDEKGNKKIKAFVCSRIKPLLDAGLIPQPIADQCCYQHPELLEGKNHGTEIRCEELAHIRIPRRADR